MTAEAEQAIRERIRGKGGPLGGVRAAALTPMIRDAAGLLRDGERVEEAAWAKMDGARGVVVVTDRRVVFARGLGTREFALDRVGSVEAGRSLFESKVDLKGSGLDAEIRMRDPRDAEALASAIRDGIARDR